MVLPGKHAFLVSGNELCWCGRSVWLFCRAKMFFQHLQSLTEAKMETATNKEPWGQNYKLIWLSHQEFTVFACHKTNASNLHGNWLLFIFHSILATKARCCHLPLLCSGSWPHLKLLPIELTVNLLINYLEVVPVTSVNAAPAWKHVPISNVWSWTLCK